MTLVYLGLGSNSGNSLLILRDAIKSIKTTLTSVVASSIYKTSPLYLSEQADFYNLVIKAETELSPQGLLAYTQSIEKAFGRNRKKEVFKGPRTLDIDILFYGIERINSRELQIPHPGILERAFVLYPLLEISPEMVHPCNQKKLSDFTEALSHQGIYLYSSSNL